MSVVFRQSLREFNKISAWRCLSSKSDAVPLVPRKNSNFQLAIIGTGWAGYKLLVESKKLRKKIESMNLNDIPSLDVIVVSERNHFLYTPLLASTTVGTLEFRSIIETVRVGDHQFRDESHFHLSSVTNVDANEKTIQCKSEIDDHEYRIPYDALVIACGARPNTFGIPGVEKYAYFLKEIWHARLIRSKILANFELATQPHITEEEKKQLLHFIVVGGGPTGVEFCAELYDFVQEDIRRIYPEAKEYLKVSLLDSGEILSMFDRRLRNFAMDKFNSRKNMKHIKQNCIEIREHSVVLADKSEIPCGLVVWTAGVGPSPLTKHLPFQKAKNGNLLTDEFCYLKGQSDSTNIFAIGDCGEIDGYPLPATAQVAQSQAEYICDLLERYNLNKPLKPYSFKGKGLMAYLGAYEGLLETSDREVYNRNIPGAKLAGWSSWFAWRSAYLTKLGSWRLRMQVPIDWLKSLIVGRDISRF